MSRTRKDRPYWVRVNDPGNVPRRESHQHIIVRREKIGEEVVTKTGWNHKLDRWEDNVPWYTKNLYRKWVEEIPCTIDVPEAPPSTWRSTKLWNDNHWDPNAKHCNYWLRWDGDYRSGKNFKRLTHSAERGKIKTQLHNAVRDFGSYWEEDDWDEIDIHNDSKYASRGWWDW